MLVDDDATLRTLLRVTLPSDGFEVTEAADGDEALALARELHPDVILLDMMMPAKSGIEVLAELRRDAELAETPVIMLTARTQAADRDAAALVGATRFLTKPFSPSELAASVDELVRERAADAA